MTTTTDRSFLRLQNRWTFGGVLQFDAPWHIGATDQGSIAVDRAVVRNAGGAPYVPASTLKGVLRATVDRLGPTAGASRNVHCCCLSDSELTCPSAAGSPAREAVEKALAGFDGSERERNSQLLSLLEERLCATCRLFGSPWLAGRVYLADGAVITPDYVPSEVRDTAGVDRDSGTLREQSRVSGEVVPAATAIAFHMDCENLDALDQALLALALAEASHGRVRLGGSTARGLGSCRLLLDRVESIDFDAAHRTQVLAYVRDGTMTSRSPETWLASSIEWLLTDEEVGESGA